MARAPFRTKSAPDNNHPVLFDDAEYYSASLLIMRIFRIFVHSLALFVYGTLGFLVRHPLTVARPPAFSSLKMSVDSPSRQMVVEGMDLFRQGDVRGSIQKFDASVPSGSNAYLWQRGLSYYYADEFKKGSQQFRDDVLRSPLDVEEIVWDIACLLRIDPTFPPPTMMSLPPGKSDRRPIMVRAIPINILFPTY